MKKQIYNIEQALPGLVKGEALNELAQDGGDNWNRLVFESSPYLLQHAANPVNWFPWSEQAFSKAKAENKPVMLSIGYATCHWCHVMEHECFEDHEVADLLNKYFIAIKVDREERPDLDNLYMGIAQSLVGRGGWPLNVFLTPDKEVFYAGTYIPKYSRNYANGKLAGMLELIPYLGELWQQRHSEIVGSAQDIMQSFSKYMVMNSTEPGQELDSQAIESLSEACFKQLAAKFDDKHGGFGSAPKFPSPHIYSFLLNYYKRTQDKNAVNMVETTLKAMRRGGVFDQVGLGFHRYSTDREWLLPHFEKMLYDQALLMMAYARCYATTQDAFYKRVTSEIYQYLVRDMCDDTGLFYSAEDADSEGEEGKFQTWSYDELKQVLKPEELQKIEKLYNLKPQGNFMDEATHQVNGRNIFHLSSDLELDTNMQSILDRLYEARELRIHPLKDDKILTDWNSLAIAALAISYGCTQESQYLDLAERSMSSLKALMLDTNLKLSKSARSGKLSKAPATIADYAFFIWALIELFQVTCKAEYIDLAMKLVKYTIDQFWDKVNGGFFYSAQENLDLPINTKELYDGAIPSANSVMAANLYFSYQYSGDEELNKILTQQNLLMYQHCKSYPSGHTQFISFLESTLEPLVMACKVWNFRNQHELGR